MANILTVKKKNRVIDIPDTQKDTYLRQGYDVVDENGEVVERATGGKQVPLAEHYKVVDELEKLKGGKATAVSTELELRVEDLSVENEELKKENADLKKECATLKGKITKLEKDSQTK